MGAAGSTPIHKAAKEGNLSELYVAVQKHSAHINQQEDDMGYTALHIAAWQGFDAIVRELLKRGANPNAQDKEGRTALHLAAIRGHTKVVEALLRANARRDFRDNLNHTAYDIAASRHPAIAAMIGAPLSSSPSGPQAGSITSQPGSVAAPGGMGQQPQPSKLMDQLSGSGGSANHTPSIYPSLPSTQPTPVPTSATATATKQQDTHGMYGQNRHVLFPPGYQSQPYAPYPSPPEQSPLDQPQLQQQQSQSPYPPVVLSPRINPAYAPTAPPYASPMDAASAPYAPPAPNKASIQEAAAVPLPSSGASVHQLNDDWAPRREADRGVERDEAPSAPPAGPESISASIASKLYQQLPPPGSATGGSGASAPAPGPLQQALLGKQHANNPLKGFFTAADLAIQQLAKLGLNKMNQGNQPQPDRDLAGPATPYVPSKVLQDKFKAPQDASGASSTASAGGQYAGPPGRTYHYADVAAATEYFASANKLGQGGFGAVYRGMLDGIPVAVKVMDNGPNAMQGQKEFAAEVNILTRLHHPHVVLLVGSCPEKGLLVYELMENGSLEDWLFRRSDGDQALPWQDRVRIAAEVASALLYLHSAPEPIVHMDLKPANILLDATLRAKLGDVGLARLMGKPAGHEALGANAPSTAQDSQLVGTLAYVDPEYLRTGQYSTKSDLYALGMVMLQMLTGGEQSSVVSEVEKAREDVLNFTYVLDSSAGPWPAAEAVAFADIALKCVEFRRNKRPDLRTEVLPALLQLKQRTSLYPNPKISLGPQGQTSMASGSSLGGGAQSQPTSQPLSLQPSSSGRNTAAGLMAGGVDTTGVPAMFLCPITQEIMRDPVVAADGYTYEREAIAAWLTRSATSPLTNLPLSSNALVPNMLLRSSIKEWLQRSHASQK